MQTRFNGNVVPFADDATSTNRTVFGGTTQSDSIDDNLNADFKKGWEIVGLNDNPTREDFNAMGYTLGALTAYLYEMGIAEWNASQNYRIRSRVIGSDGKIYKALTGTTGTPNVNHNPVSDTVNWEWELKTITDYSALTSKTTPVDADLLALGDSASSFSLKKLTWANLKTVLFGSPALTGTPTAPTPTAGDNSTKVATTAFIPIKFSADGFSLIKNATGGAIKNQCTAWADVSATPALSASYNFSSVTYASDTYTLTFTTQMDNTNYVVVGAQNESYIDTNNGGGFAAFDKTLTGFKYKCPTNIYNTKNMILVFGGKN